MLFRNFCLDLIKGGEQLFKMNDVIMVVMCMIFLGVKVVDVDKVFIVCVMMVFFEGELSDMFEEGTVDFVVVYVVCDFVMKMFVMEFCVELEVMV